MKLKQILLGTLLAASALSAHAQYQFPNSDFESEFIGAGGSNTEPQGWHGYATIDASTMNSAGRAGNKLVASTDVRPGSTGKQSVYVMSSSIFGVVANGVMTNGQIYTHSTTPTDGKNNYNFSEPGRVVDAYAPNSQFYTPFTGKPDAMRVWLKNEGSGTARVCVWLHTNGTMYDPTDKADMNIVCAKAVTAVPNNKEWKQYDIPFGYAGYNGKTPEYILATFTTNETPGKGADGDKMFIDDIEMIYYSEMINPTYNGQAIEIDATGSATINAAYNAKMLKYTTGVGATVTTDAKDDGTVTVTIEGNDISVNPGNRHVYTLHFTKGIDAGKDDESIANVSLDILAKEEVGAGTYCIVNHNGKFLDEHEVFSDRHVVWTISGTNNNYKFKNPFTGYSGNNGPYLAVGRTQNATGKDDMSKIFAQTSYKDAYNEFKIQKTADDNFVPYRNIQYYDGGLFGLGKASADFYLMSNDDNTFGWQAKDVPAKGWILYNADQVDIIDNLSTFSLSNSHSASSFVKDGETRTLPLGLYSVSGTGSVNINGKTYTAADGMFYVPFDNTTTFTNTPGLNYYGRLNFDLTATYNGASVKSEDNINDVYDEALFLYSATGNGVENVEKYYDPETRVLTVTVSGYGRSREHTFQFAAADFSFNATWYGDKLEDGQTINEEFSEAGLNVTPGKGATVTTDAAEDGTVTITLTSGNDSQTYTLHFLTYPAETADAVTVSGALVASYDNAEATHVPTLGINYNADGNLNLHISALVDNAANQYENIVVKNVSLDTDGNFYYAGNVRNEAGKLVPTVLRGQVKDGQLVAAAIDASLINPSITTQVKRVFMHATYGFAAAKNSPFAGSIVVTVNGDATEIKNQTINVVSLDNGNISFTLNDFAMPMGDANAPIGNIAIDDLAIDADGNFAYNGGILIGPGNDQTHEWGGLDMGIIPLDLRGQVYDYEGQQQLIVVIDINLQESLGQTVHVTFGADAVKTDYYLDDLNILVNGEKTVISGTNVEIGTLRNGNVNLVLKDFKMNVAGVVSPIGNIAIDNVPLDAKGNFVYNGIIRIGKGSDPTVSWGGPELGDVPVTLRGSICDASEFACDNNSLTTDNHCVLVLDVDMQKSLEQTIHITYGLDVVDTKMYTDILAVTVNGATTTQEQEVTVQYLPNGNINFLLDNFYLQTEMGAMPIGAIRIENLIVDEQGKFTFDGAIRIGNGSTPGVAWGGPELGDVPLLLDGQLFTKDGQNYLLVNIDIDLEESLKQTVNVTFGATPVSTKTYTDDLQITVNGEVSSQQATIEVGMLKNGYMNFNLKNFAMQVGGQPMYIGNIAINALELDADGRFSYNGNVRIGEGDLEGVASWGGPDLGAIPLNLKGQLYEYEGEEYLLVNIAIELESLQQTVDVLFGGTPIRTVELTDNLLVTINGQENRQQADVTVGILRNGNINFTLRNFMLALDGSENLAPIGNLAINNMELAEDGTFSYSGNIRIGNGDDANVDSWGGPDLGDIPVVMTGKFSEKGKKLHAVIDIELESLQQTVNVEFGADFVIAESIGDIVKLINDALAGKATVKDIENAVDMLLGK